MCPIILPTNQAVPVGHNDRAIIPGDGNGPLFARSRFCLLDRPNHRLDGRWCHHAWDVTTVAACATNRGPFDSRPTWVAPPSRTMSIRSPRPRTTCWPVSAITPSNGWRCAVTRHPYRPQQARATDDWHAYGHRWTAGGDFIGIAVPRGQTTVNGPGQNRRPALCGSHWPVGHQLSGRFRHRRRERSPDYSTGGPWHEDTGHGSGVECVGPRP